MGKNIIAESLDLKQSFQWVLNEPAISSRFLSPVEMTVELAVLPALGDYSRFLPTVEMTVGLAVLPALAGYHLSLLPSPFSLLLHPPQTTNFKL